MRIFVFLVALMCCQAGQAQQSQQVIGRVEDYTSRSVLPGANIILSRDTLGVAATSDANGVFVFRDVFPGRYTLQVSFTGYETVQQELLVISARRTEIAIRLREFQNTLGEVQIVSGRAQVYEPGRQVITNEKALRLPANFFDPVRVITSYPGVITANDQNNTIVIRGNSPAGLLWRINGLDVVNPNHLANAGTLSDKPAAYGGGVNIISAQLMEQTDFYTGAQPVQYGNARAGVIDMKLRSGDTTGYKYTAQASLIGIDLAAEGPIGKKNRTSFLANYRYSTVGLLSMMGVKFGDEAIGFQDLTFSLNASLANGRNLSWFGFVGSSKNEFEHKAQHDWEADKDQYDIGYRSKNLGTGMVFNQSLHHTNFSAGASVSVGKQNRDQFSSPEIAQDVSYVIYEDRLDMKSLLVSAFGRLDAKINNQVIETGVQLNYRSDNLSLFNHTGSTEVERIGEVDGLIFQPYASWKLHVSERFNAQVGMRYAYFTYNETGSVEPRLSVEFLPTTNSSLKASYSRVSQFQSAATYTQDNESLQPTKAHHLDLAYTVVSNTGFRFSSNAYYQSLFDVPVDALSSSYSLLNAVEVFPFSGLVSEGTGRNYGWEALVEKSFFDKSYFIGAVSLYKSQYKGSDGVMRNTRFDGNYSVNFTYGREWTKIKKQTQRAFGMSTRVLYLGGLRETPVVANPSEPGTVYDESRAFEDKLKDYFRLDLRLNWRKNRKNHTRTIAIDIQNLFNVQNEAFRYYDHVRERVTTQYQLGMIPVLVYRVDF